MEDNKKTKSTDASRYEYTGDLPLGLGMALTHNIPAMKVFASLPEKERKRYIELAGGISSRAEMNDLVNTLIK